MYILSSEVVYFSDTLPSKAPILIIIYHVELNHFALTVHPNPLIKQIPLNVPLAIQQRRLKRKCHTDILTQDWQHKGDC